MIPVPSSVRVWLAVGRTDMRRGMNGLALQVQQALGRDPHAGDLYVFRGARGDLIKILWWDGLGMSLYAKRLERGRFIWPSPADGSVAISASQRAGRVRLDSLTGKISGSSAGYRHDMPFVGLTQGGRSPTGERPTNGGKNYAAAASGRLSKYARSGVCPPCLECGRLPL
jgi:transposase